MTAQDPTESPSPESHEAVRWRIAGTIRRLATTLEADELLAAFERMVLRQHEGPSALDALEQQPDWAYENLLQEVLDHGGTVEVLDSAGHLRLRQYQLLGWLADACEEALVAGDLATAGRVSRLAHAALLRAKVEAIVGTDDAGVA